MNALTQTENTARGIAAGAAGGQGCVFGLCQCIHKNLSSCLCWMVLIGFLSPVFCPTCQNPQTAQR